MYEREGISKGEGRDAFSTLRENGSSEGSEWPFKEFLEHKLITKT